MSPRIRNRLHRLARDTRGTYLIEFAALTLPLTLLLMSGIELGYLAYAKSTVEGGLREVSRLAATGSATPAELDTLLNGKINQISNTTTVIRRRSYASFTDVDQPEPLTSDVAPLGGAPGAGDCFLDINPNGTWDADMGISGIGGSGDILYYGVTVTYPVLFGLTSRVLNSGSPTMTIEANAVIKNEPFGNETDPVAASVCIA